MNCFENEVLQTNIAKYLQTDASKRKSPLMLRITFVATSGEQNVY